MRLRKQGEKSGRLFEHLFELVRTSMHTLAQELALKKLSRSQRTARDNAVLRNPIYLKESVRNRKHPRSNSVCAVRPTRNFGFPRERRREGKKREGERCVKAFRVNKEDGVNQKTHRVIPRSTGDRGDQRITGSKTPLGGASYPSGVLTHTWNTDNAPSSLRRRLCREKYHNANTYRACIMHTLQQDSARRESEREMGSRERKSCRVDLHVGRGRVPFVILAKGTSG